MKIADIEFGEKPILLAPMEDVTDPSFRFLCKHFGAAMVYTEFVSSDGLIRDAAKSLAKLQISDEERPVGIQIYGHLIDAMVEAAKIAEAARPDVIDINFGCPVKKIAHRGAGSGIMKDVQERIAMTKAIVDGVKVTVTVKSAVVSYAGMKMASDYTQIIEIEKEVKAIISDSLTDHSRQNAGSAV